ncbi:sialate O-acetylesterase [Blastopirellula marina]|uniref:Sialate O-acetylesterase n=1 Tax=Blastopirellula marina TaxID=124 RepID=A0A2S8FA98_9BACT|nr:sialate O-acetylesterase [Blastopirellula marina]PQO29077.1 sialate O-acetylesterase [Blastopirellula marina]PTL42349.1 sialate O-acetylesterase [Blastopirellula marina]
MSRLVVMQVLIIVAMAALPAVSKADDTYQVFILAGQSNMEGKASNELIEHQATDPATAEIFSAFRDGDKWAEREDVSIKFLNRHGPLTVGYGSPNKTGLELAFGTAMGEYYDEPVLLIKTAWGGHSLYQKFRSPSAGLPSDEVLQAELDKAQEKTKKENEKRNRNDPLPTMEQIKAEYGVSYRNMMTEVEETLKNADELFPQLKGKKPHIAGFVWFQGFNDMFGDYATQEYEQNMKFLIQDVRKAWDSPKLPVVIGALGQNGSKPAAENMKAIQDAQLAMNEVPEFAGNVKTIRTDVLVDKTAEEKFPTWKENFEEWKLVGSDRPYHYFGSAIWYTRIGNELAKTMLEMKGSR